MVRTTLSKLGDPPPLRLFRKTHHGATTPVPAATPNPHVFEGGISTDPRLDHPGPLWARASFETPIKHIINAALVGEIDELDSVVENVMLNQPIPIGTGIPSLITKGKK